MRKPEILVFAGPNGSGKSTITQNVEIIGEYINADDIKKELNCSDLEAAQKATTLRENYVLENKDFTFETVLSSRRNLDLLIKAKEQGYFIKCFYVITSNPYINIQRVLVRTEQGGHSVPDDKILSRYEKCKILLPELIDVCDVIHIYDNTVSPFRIFKKKKDLFQKWESKYWPIKQIEQLTNK